MTPLEQRIKEEITYVGQTDDDLNDDAKTIAAIVLELVEKAYKADRETFVEGRFKEWLKENGLE